MAYIRKTHDEYELMFDYGYGDGLELITRASSCKEAKSLQKEYIENEGICPIIRKVRVKNG